MKKNLFTKKSSHLSYKLSLRMKLSVLLTFVTFITLQANNSYSQNRITLELEDVSVATLLDEIESKSDFRFVYRTIDVDLKRKISIKEQNQKITSILDRTFQNTNTDYKIINNQIFLRKSIIPNDIDDKPQSKTEKSENFQFEINGTVIDTNGAPLPGASIVEKGTPNGTQSDFDGNYSITVNNTSVLIFSYIGFLTQEIPINQRTTIDITMFEDTSELEEVVVTGYTAQTRGDITGAVSSVDMSEAVKTPTVNVAEALQGRVSGVTVIDNGTPGMAPKVTVRGFGTSNNTNPLYIIDGVQTEDVNVLNSINSNDIEQMNVLKDASAAIYGARASNGVIIITTKGGGYNMEKPIISIDAYSGLANATNLPGMLNAQQFADMTWQSLSNDGAPLTHPQFGSGPTPVVPSSLIDYRIVTSYNPIVKSLVGATVQPGGTNWFDEITRTALVTNGSVSIRGGNKTGKYFMSTNYLDREGVLITTGFKQGVTRLNSEFRLFDKIVIGEHLSGSFSKTVAGNSIDNAYNMNPLVPVYDDEGRLAGASAPGTGGPPTPVAVLLRGKDDYEKLFRLIGDIYVSAELFDGLKFKTSFGGTIESLNYQSFQHLAPEEKTAITTNALTEGDASSFNWTWSNTLNYNKTFGVHSVNFLAGIEAVDINSKGKQVSRSGYLYESPDYYLLSNGSGPTNIDLAFDNGSSLFSVFGTANYSYKSKYFGTITVRSDKSSRFEGDNKSDIFPSFSAGWLLSEEGFFPKEGFISRLKLKGSWGELGNQTLPTTNPTINIIVLSESMANYAINGSAISTGAMLDQVGNPELKWETSESLNFGIDLGLFSNQFLIELDYYDIKTKDLITRDLSLIGSTAIDAQPPLVNLGNVRNTGFDLSLGYTYTVETNPDFSFNIRGTFSRYNNEVTKLISDFQTGRTDLRGGAVTRTEAGYPLSSFYGRKVTGIDDNGRFTYKDIDGNGIINDEDRDYIGSPHPDFTYGLNIAVNLKKFDISIFFTGSQGNDIYNYEKIYTDFATLAGNNRSIRVLDSWTPTNTDAILPALSNSVLNSETTPNSYFVEDGSYLRLKNLQLGYNLPSRILEKIRMQQFRLYLQGTNLFTITGYDGLDPEVISNDNLSLAIDTGTYPVPRIISLGVNIKL